MKLKSWLDSGAATLHRLTYPQRELWEAAPLDVKDAANSICCVMHIRGLLGEDAARQALRRVVDRHEVLRLSILPGKNGPLQLVRKSGELAIVFRDVAECDVEAASDEFFAQPFDLVIGPLYRILVLRLAADRHLVLFAMHHAIGDGWSWGVFAQDLVGAYLRVIFGDDRPLPELPQSYTAWGATDQAYWTEGLLNARRTFWKPQLADLPRLWAVPIASGHFIRCSVSMPTGLVARIRTLAAAHGTTLYSTLLAVFQIAFGKWAGTADIVVGSPVANRRGRLTGEIVGSFASMLPIRGRIEPAMSLADHLRRTHHAASDCFANAMPFVELVQLAGAERVDGFNPLYEVRFALQNQPVPRLSAPGFEAELENRWTGTPRFQVACEISEQGETLDVVWIANAGLFASADIERLDNLFQSALQLACRAPETAIADFG